MKHNEKRDKTDTELKIPSHIPIRHKTQKIGPTSNKCTVLNHPIQLSRIT